MGKKDKPEENDIPKYEDTIPSYEDTIPTEAQQQVADYILAPDTGPSMGESALLGAEQGLTLNHAPQLGAAFGAGLESGAGALGMGPQAANEQLGLPKQSLSEIYNEYLKLNKQRDLAAAQKNPWSYGAGGVAGGLLGFKGGSMLAKPAAAAIAEKAPLVAATGQVMNKIYPNAIPMAIAGGVMAEGAGEHPIMSPQGAEEIAQGVAGGLAMNSLLPPVISGTAKVAGMTAKGAKEGAKKLGGAIFGELTPDAYLRGFRNKELLVGKKAAEQTGDEMLQFGLEVPQMIEQQANKLGAEKLAILRIAQENGVRIDPADIDNFINTYLRSGSPSSLVEVQREIHQLHELLKTAKSGPEVQKITRRYFGMGNTEKGEFANLFSQKQAEQEALAATEPKPPLTQKQQFEQLHAQKQAEQQAIPGSNPNPLELTYEPIPGSKNVLGIIRQIDDGVEPTVTWKKLGSRIIDANNPDEVKMMEDLLTQRQAEQRAIPGGVGPEDIQLHYEPIEDDPNRVVAILRQKQMETGTPGVYKKIASQVIAPDALPIVKPKLEMILQPTDVPGKSLGIIRQAIVDSEGNITGYKKVASKLLSEEEAAAWKDVSEVVRAGGKDLSEPEQLYQLYQDLKNKSQFGEYSFKTNDAKAITSQAIQDVQAMLRKYMSELEPTDAKITAINRAQEILGSVDRDPRNVMKTFAAMLGKTEGNSILPGAGARRDLTDLINQLKIANPELGHKIEARAHDLANKFAVTGAVQKEIYIPRPLATLKAYSAKSANLLGYSLGQITPEWMTNTAVKLGQIGGKGQQMLSDILLKAASKDESTRTAIMFSLMQQPAYRAMLKEYMPTEQPTKERVK